MRCVVSQGEINNPPERNTWKLRVYARNLNGTMEAKLNKEGNEARRDDEKVAG